MDVGIKSAAVNGGLKRWRTRKLIMIAIAISHQYRIVPRPGRVIYTTMFGILRYERFPE